MSRLNLTNQKTPNFFLKKTAKISLELSTPRGAVFCFFSKRKRLQRACLVAMAATQRRLPYVAATQKLRAVSRKHRFFVVVISVFFLCFLALCLFCFVQKKCCFFLLLLFAAILAVSVCPFGSLCCCNFAVVLALAFSKHYSLDLAFSPCVFLVCFLFFCSNKRCLLFLQFCCCVCCCVSRWCCLLFLCFLLRFFARLTKQYIRLLLPIFAGSTMLFLLSFGAFWRCCIFLLAPRLGHACLTMPPMPSSMLRVTHFSLRSAPQHSYTPFRPICVSVHPLHEHTYGYLCVDVFMCFALLLAALRVTVWFRLLLLVCLCLVFVFA